MYRVSWGYYGDYSRDFADFDAALAFYRAKPDAQLTRPDGVDGDCDQDGFFMCSDGLTEEQRERLCE